MTTRQKAIFTLLFAAFLAISCVSEPFTDNTGAETERPYDAVPQEAALRIPEPPDVPPIETAPSETSPPITALPPESEQAPLPPIPEYILGRGLTGAESLLDFLVSRNAGAESFAAELANLYIEEAAAEGVNHDIAFAQMCLETGFLRYGGLVTPDMNNFCGLGATGPSARGESFPDPRTGVRAHIQHLKAYATDEFPTQELVDPRYFWISYGSSPKISSLSGTWAQDPLYAEKINAILQNLYQFAFGPRENNGAPGEPEPDTSAANENAKEALEEDTEKMLDKMGVTE